MATLAESGFPNLAEIGKRLKKDGSAADIINIMSKKLNLLDDVPWNECSDNLGHEITQAYSLPTPGYRKLNRGIDASKADTETFLESTGMLEDESKVDVDMAKTRGGPVWRASEDKLKKEAFAQKFATDLFYQSASTNPEAPHGFAPRFGATTGLTASAYTLKGTTNSGSNCRSIWLVTWADRKAYGIYPKGSMAGLLVEDKGEQRVTDSDSKPFWAHVTKLQWKWGLAVEDYRYIVRFQYDPDDAAFQSGELGIPLALGDMLSTIFEVLPSTRFYMDRTTEQLMNKQLAKNDANLLTYMSMGTDGKPLGVLVPSFRGVPIRITDALVAETAIS